MVLNFVHESVDMWKEHKLVLFQHELANVDHLVAAPPNVVLVIFGIGACTAFIHGCDVVRFVVVASGNFHGVLFEGERFDCGDKAGFVKATIAMALARDDIGDEVRAYLESLQH